ncbi:GH92 family glycosyl hydrolase [Ulvibacter antarcticus]|uniref:Putative alpha-1,2-mannosidase n=1 Tax=Ulvibacter antarcticus TaxID=442714 RepID=A0A3L9YYE2_9FLAO|nr:GH92 family glycosyl hydrolase [Ulvibacter antarcticus]RMA65751.1 putative alpha-1,2-mannosidase [Ulvibacter antarcticus]
MKNLSFLFFLFFVVSCSQKETLTPAKKDKSLTDYVNTFIGTGGHGHTYPGASMPFGMMQLSPDTRLDGWDGCSGYHYSDNYIYGFSHTHLSGTGVSDYGDILLMPTNSVNFNNGANGKKGYGDYFTHDNETASPGFYKVHLDSTNIEVELTVTARAGMHKYSFPSSENQVLILDLEHRDKLLDFNITQLSDTEISGHRFSEAWATNQKLFFYIQFSHPIKSPPESLYRNPDRRARKAAYTFNNPKNDPVYVSIGISAVDIDGAKKNLMAEIGTKTFDQLKLAAEASWETQLEKIVIESDNTDYKTNFYSALYHSMLAPNLYQDVDGRYRGMDLEIHQNDTFNYYTVFSLWDTYRAAHPLYTIIEQQRTNDFINTFLTKYDEGGIMPIWDLSANYTGCMIGYHAVPVIADAYAKGIRGYDAEKAFTAMKHSAIQDQLGLEAYKKYGYIPVEEESESVSKTLEYAYDDWTIAQMAKALGKTEDYKLFSERAQNYKNVFDPQTNFMRGRFRNTWFAPFDPYEVNFNYTEANAWQYSMYVPQDISGFMKMMGGKKVLERQLDTLFIAKAETSGRDQADITGLIGQYAHGNEPSHHMAYLYNFVNKPYKTQEKVHQILTELYKNAPDGISGNEDCGQMSAWYVLSSLGFYPVTPGSNQYIIGTPLFPKATINLENNQQFNIVANNISNENKYIESANLNGKELTRSFLYHNEIVDGGSLVFNMTNSPSSWANKDKDVPVTEIVDHLITPAPFLAEGDVAFKNQTKIVLKVASEETKIYYNLNNSEYKEYTEPLILSEETILKTYAEKNDRKSSELSTQFYKIDPMLSISLETEYANQYNAGGNNALIDGIRGAKDFRTGAWQGYQDTDLIAMIDLGSVKSIESISVNFLQDQRSWIFYPTEVNCSFSEDNTNYTKLPTRKIASATPSEATEIKNIQFDTHSKKGRYIKIRAKNLGALPKWHLGAPFNGTAWIFVDEIEISSE